MRKLLFIVAGLVLTFASADATSRTKSTIQMIYQPQPNGDYRLSLYGSERTLVCEEHKVQIVQQGDAINPLIIECKH